MRLDSVPENVMLVRQALDGAARELGASPEVIEDLKLAVTEACSNVVKYAYGGSPGELEVSLGPVDNGFNVFVRDNGHWLDRDEAAAQAGGLGIPLMEAVTRDLALDSDDFGTTVRLEFALNRPGSDEDADPANG
jgi:serine/threonine-protein kinase RsbW